MPSTPPAPDPALLVAAQLNARIRRLSAGRTSWSAEELTQLARLQAEWQAAVEGQAEGQVESRTERPEGGAERG
ncbi:hypothetical protein ABZ901_10380 [Actinacidiphila alni]|uniref:hypothetical protein n=1 Tax=Actinacidiphila alni TaxID=380248 RepID=UPI0033F9BA9F